MFENENLVIKTKVKNSAGELIELRGREARLAQINQRFCNALGYQIDITTMTAITKRVVDQKFFEVAPADYVPIRVGEGAWSTSLLTYRSYQIGDEFETGIVNTGGNNGRLAQINTAIDALQIVVRNWAKELTYTLFDVEYASRSGNWDLVTSLEKSRKTNWDLGIQRVAFLGARNDSSVLGLLNQAGISANVSLINEPISTMDPTELKTFLAGLIAAYRVRCNYTAWPTHFIIPEIDYLGLGGQSSPDFPIKSTLVLVEETLQAICKNKNFKVLPLAYATPANSGGALTYPRYTLLNYNEDSIRMDIPVDYTNTLANSLNNFSYQNVGYGQFTGVLAYRPLELMYFDID